jgi:hypothetical protein
MSKTWTDEEVLTLARSYQPVCALGAAAHLGVFDAIGADAIDAEETAARIRGDVRGTAVLLDALVALELLDKRDSGRYAVPPSLRPLLTTDSPDSLLAMTRLQMNCLRRWAGLAHAVRDGGPYERPPSVLGEDGDLAAFIEAMDNVNRSSGPGVVASLQPLPFRHLLDVGGGSGTWTLAWLAAQPEARATLFDLPEVIPMARRRLERAGALDRVDLVAGDFYVDALPEGADLVWLSAIAHQNSRAQNRDLFAKIRAAVRPGARLLVRDMVMDATRTRPQSGALFAVNMLVATRGGGTFTFDEFAEDLGACGFADVALLHPEDGMDAVVGAKAV